MEVQKSHVNVMSTAEWINGLSATYLPKTNPLF